MTSKPVSSQFDLAWKVGLSATGVYKRLKHLRQDRYIKKVTALPDRSKLGLNLLCSPKVTFRGNLQPDNLADGVNIFRGFIPPPPAPAVTVVFQSTAAPKDG